MNQDEHPPGSMAVCRHCGKLITRLVAGWTDLDGFFACVKSPTYSVRDAVLHVPMPDGLIGAAFASIVPD